MDDIDDVEDHSFRNPRVPCPHDASGSGRNLILCIDGTANQFGEKNTNVIELYNLILKDARFGQRTWYNSGVGTYARPHWRSFKYYQQVVFHKIDLAIACAYELYVDSGSDKTRAQPIGSTNAQSSEPAASAGPPHGSASLMSRLKKAFPFVFGSEKSVSRGQSDASAGRLQDTVSMAERFKRAFSQKNVRVHFVGAWYVIILGP
ncbi:hypothetical protein EST38_g7229 [Candolleomyces aberdarensis]|uniref:T6SS Phospholipase effector Tle1-like catalytic domain-containing protein n=1 Tax=Candolleomyces aberdarensis TaxID=2316362 RepID=A0A4Q2DIZ6_9AGAR|nr:hypothetical protein EST38_g7229 [Candolleomyces aberdarensis]